MNSANIRYALDNLYSCDDRLGVELMGAPKWNALKRYVTASTAQRLKDVPDSLVVKVRPSNYVTQMAKRAKSMTNPLSEKLFGFNYEYGAQLLGNSVWNWMKDAGSGIASATHKVLEAGEDVPFIDQAVASFRDWTSFFNKGKSASSSAYSFYENNKWKILIIGGGVVILGVYLLGRRGGSRRRR